jgi:hypothetical protein
MHTSNRSSDSAVPPQRFSASGLRYLLRFFFAAALMLSAAETLRATAVTPFVPFSNITDTNVALKNAATTAYTKATSPGATPADKIAAAQALAAASAVINPTDASLFAMEAAELIADKTVANSNPLAAAQVAATVTKVVSNPAVANFNPVWAALVATQATYVVNLPSVAASDPTAVASVNTNVTAISSIYSVSSNPTNANMATDLANAKTDGQANVNVTIQLTTVTTPATPLVNTPHQDITVVSASS